MILYFILYISDLISCQKAISICMNIVWITLPKIIQFTACMYITIYTASNATETFKQG